MSYSPNHQDSRLSYDGSIGDDHRIVDEEELDSPRDIDQQQHNENNGQSSASLSDRASYGLDYYEKVQPELINSNENDNYEGANPATENGKTFQMSVTDQHSPMKAIPRQISFEQDKRRSIESNGNDQDWAKNNREKGKVSDLIKRFNNGGESNNAANQPKYKQDYDLGKSVAQIRQNKFQ